MTEPKQTSCRRPRTDGRETRTAIIAQGVPHPTRGASTVLYFHYIDGLRKAGHRILLVLLVQDENYVEDRYQELLSALEGDAAVTVKTLHASRFVESSRFTHRLVSEPLAGLKTEIESFGPQFLLCFDLMAAWAAQTVAAPTKTVWLGDLLFQTTWYNSLYSWREGTGRPWHLVWAVFQSSAWRRIYRQVLKAYQNVVVSSKSSEAALDRLGIASRYLPYPWPETTAAEDRGGAKTDPPCFIFFGSLQALGSRSALHMLLEEIYPLLRQQFGAGRFRISICGQGGLPDWTTAALREKPEIEYLGFVATLDTVFSAATALIAPIDVPVGNRSRILTAMAKGLLVIAHRNAALGNPDLIDGRTCFLASDAADFVAKMERSTTCREEIEAITRNARDMYREKFSPDRAVRALIGHAFRTEQTEPPS